ncbi:hypothetical protein [Spongiactinospora gelatinilytica]|uniref:hypothetical protein n=1 Tax=Spongiactinospora gelatinilytica TaxID=2666298 RepID=UPI0013145325|nr:hypothetical protein [Spongiactinospora gelatinilytica]
MSRERLLRTLGIAAIVVGLFIGLSPIPHNGVVAAVVLIATTAFARLPETVGGVSTAAS